MPDTAPKTGNDRAPSLGISHIVYGRRSKANRVEYLVDPHGHGDKMAIPETVVLRRWRAKCKPGYIFGGTRLSPTIWKAVDATFSETVGEICQFDLELLERRIESARPKLSKQHLTMPNAEQLKLIFDALGAKRLEAIMERHLAPERGERFGTPDLFLHARKEPTKELSHFRFVEVKRPGEHISNDQKEEIAFLRSLKLPARILRLIERMAPASNSTQT